VDLRAPLLPVKPPLWSGTTKTGSNTQGPENFSGPFCDQAIAWQTPVGVKPNHLRDNWLQHGHQADVIDRDRRNRPRRRSPLNASTMHLMKKISCNAAMRHP
jgi:hypothetical protein